MTRVPTIPASSTKHAPLREPAVAGGSVSSVPPRIDDRSTRMAEMKGMTAEQLVSYLLCRGRTASSIS